MNHKYYRFLFVLCIVFICLFSGCETSSESVTSDSVSGSVNSPAPTDSASDTSAHAEPELSASEPTTPMPSPAPTASPAPELYSENHPSLAETYSDYFTIGVAISPALLQDIAYTDVLCRQFNSFTNENNFKPESIIDKTATLSDIETNNTRLVLNFSKVTAELDFAAEHNIKMRGHTLIWHNQTPDFIFYENYDTNLNLVSRDIMIQRMENYIKDVFEWVAANYPDTFYAWDVVNEAIADDGTLRDNLWRQTIGDDYIELAFSFARKYAPEGIALFYNDYNSYQFIKQDTIIKTLRPVAEAGNLDGIGMQGHINTEVKPLIFTKAAETYAEELNVIIHVTELDVSQSSQAHPEYGQGVYYQEFFTALIQSVEKGTPIENVSVWGLTDSLSWKSEEKPLLFNGDLTIKPAFLGTLYAVTGGTLSPT